MATMRDMLERPVLRNAFNVIMGLALIAAIFVAIRMWSRLSQAIESTNWPTTEGTVLRSEVETRHHRRGVEYCPHVEYSYAVDGKQYIGEHVAPWGDGMGSDEETAKEVVQAYPVGAKITTVRYDPDDPASACLRPGVTGMQYVNFFVLPNLIALIPCAWFWREFKWLQVK